MALDYIRIECPICHHQDAKLYDGETDASCERCGCVFQVEPEEPEAA
jgi:ribosomal protein S27E